MKSILILLCATLAFATEEDVKEFAAGNKLFTGTIYNEILVDNSENILVSPFSVETVLALTQSGAVGVTGEELRASLYLPETKEETDLVVKGVLERINSDDQYTLHTANKVYVEKNFAIKEEFQNVATEDYHAAFENIEFADNVNAAADINQWVEEQTNNKIHDIVSPESLNEATRVVLVNALYFQANWTVPFIPLYYKKPFYAPNEKVVDVDTMLIVSESFNFYESPELDAKFLELPLLGKDASMTFILPNKKDGIAVLEKQIKTALAAPKYTSEYVRVFLPKFKIQASIEFEDILAKLGVHAAFNPEIADFSGIAGKPGELVISKITQKTFIDVNEVGVEAAAATVIDVDPPSIKPSPTQIFTVDHPFIFYISVDGVILFEGRVLVPEY